MRLAGAQCDVPGVPATLVVGVQQQPGQLAEGTVGAGHMAGDGRRDPVTMLGCALAVLTQDQTAAIGAETARPRPW